MRLDEEWLLCPRCGSRIFYVERDERLFFFHVDAERRLEAVKPEYADLSALDITVLHCTSCSWNGNVEELQAEAAAGGSP